MNETSSESQVDLSEVATDLKSIDDLRQFLLTIRDKMTEHSVAPIYVMAAMNHIMSISSIYDLLDQENKELARDIWLRLKQAGVALASPPLLFDVD